VGADHR